MPENQNTPTIYDLYPDALDHHASPVDIPDMIASVPPHALTRAADHAARGASTAGFAEDRAVYKAHDAESALEAHIAGSRTDLVPAARNALGRAVSDAELATLERVSTRPETELGQRIVREQRRISRPVRALAAFTMMAAAGLGTAQLINSAQESTREATVAHDEVFKEQYPDLAVKMSSKELGADSHVTNAMLSGVVALAAGAVSHAATRPAAGRIAHNVAKRQKKRRT